MPIHLEPFRDGLLVTCTGSVHIAEIMESHAAKYTSGRNSRFVLCDLTDLDELAVTHRELAFVAIQDAKVGARAQGIPLAVAVTRADIRRSVLEYGGNVVQAGGGDPRWALEVFPDMEAAKAWCLEEAVKAA
ncbi:MAG: hypothetical protein JJ896_11880 [Rhodothermales bacterium]|nr:hypothetical protein [Rhodothermales bacterium]MBO6780344.1 hypothetical protein [Rhodothermales bacterium]